MMFELTLGERAALIVAVECVNVLTLPTKYGGPSDEFVAALRNAEKKLRNVGVTNGTDAREVGRG